MDCAQSAEALHLTSQISGGSDNWTGNDVVDKVRLHCSREGSASPR